MKSIDKKVGEATYYKYKINLPKRIVEESGLNNKDLKVKLDNNKIVIEE